MTGQQKHVFEFSSNNKLFAVINIDGKLLIWDTETSSLKQTFTLSTGANAICTALCWIEGVQFKQNKGRRSSIDKLSSSFLALGTSTGKVEIFSYGTGKIEYVFKGIGHTGPINEIYFDGNDTIYSCAVDAHLLKWSVSNKSQITAIKLGNEVLHSCIILPGGESAVTAGRQLKWWNITDKKVLQSFAGHTSNITKIKLIKIASESYILSASNLDRILSLWSLNTGPSYKNSIATFLMEDIALNVNCQIEDDQILTISAVTRSGVVHYFKENFQNLKKDKPNKPKVTIEMVSNAECAVESIPSIAANFIRSKSNNSEELLIGYGEKQFIRFENIALILTNKSQVEIRDDPRKIRKQLTEKQKDNTLIPQIEHDKVEYHTLGSLNRSAANVKELPMETRLENLSFDTDKQTGVKTNNLSQLLIQGLHSQDANILRLVFTNDNENVINTTLKKLPPQYVCSLIDQLNTLMNKKTFHIDLAVKWLKVLLQTHSSQLMALGSDDLFQKFGPSIGVIEHRINNLKSLSRVRGRLDLLVNQIKSKDTDIIDNSNLLVYQDEDNSSNELSEQDAHSSVNEEWEVSEDDNNESDEEMDVSDNN